MYSFRCDLSEHMCTAQAEPLSAEESEEAAPVERKKAGSTCTVHLCMDVVLESWDVASYLKYDHGNP